MSLDNRPVNRKVTLSLLWTAMLFFYAYVDIFGFYRADIIQGALAGRVPIANLAIDQLFLVNATLYVTVPILMIVVSLLIPAKINRWVNIVVAVLYAASVVALAIGDPWHYYVLGSVFETILLLGIAVLAWRWPRTGVDTLADGRTSVTE
ncbi:DUF6326 family protein [Ammonicoccus fulvus]|uniref:DUF6326 family protein n=1 Tax=Ammonicoccus fulvus TaxID=3138240 RepID=A0ABZ3FSC1_9ACTN